MLYPLLFAPIIKKMVWGHESWDISCRANENEMSAVENGPLAGRPFGELINESPAGMLGGGLAEFPLLLKIIEAVDDLSVQVHPDDALAAKWGLESGKNEVWYVLKTRGRLLAGLRDGATPDAVRKEPMAWLSELEVRPGDMLDIRAGLVHAMAGGTSVVEIQQNSDVTFRLHDYGRTGADGRPRQLHVERALAAMDFKGRIPKTAARGAVRTPFFCVSELRVNGRARHRGGGVFSLLTCVRGGCQVAGVPLGRLRSMFLPAGLGPCEISGDALLLKTAPRAPR